MNKRRFYKNKHSDMYKTVVKEIGTETKNATEQWKATKCRQVAELEDRHDYFALYEKIKALTEQGIRAYKYWKQ